MSVTIAPAKTKFISADSHIVEPPELFIDYIDPKFRDRAPRVVQGPRGGDYYVVEGFEEPFTASGSASAGMELSSADFETLRMEETNPGGWDARQRLIDQDRDGVSAEILYPTLGMMLCSLEDVDFKAACMDAYNRWLQDFVSYCPDRLYGLGQTPVRSVESTISDFIRIKEMGFRGVMMPAEPCGDEDYHSPIFDPLWQAAIDLDLPLSFHVFTSGRERKDMMGSINAIRGPKPNKMVALMRMNQDIIGTFIWGGVFSRFPDLRIVCTEADAGWVPHMKQRMDHYYFQRGDLKSSDMPRPPSEYFDENVYLTFQDDAVALKLLDLINPERLLWANDFPHPDASWPRSQEILAEQMVDLPDREKELIVGGNAARLYNLDQ